MYKQYIFNFNYNLYSILTMIEFPPTYYGDTHPGWNERIFILDNGDYWVGTFKYDSLKVESPCFLQPAGEPEGFEY